MKNKWNNISPKNALASLILESDVVFLGFLIGHKQNVMKYSYIYDKSSHYIYPYIPIYMYSKFDALS